MVQYSKIGETCANERIFYLHILIIPYFRTHVVRLQKRIPAVF